MKTHIHYRQGDVLIERVDSFPVNLDEVPRDNGRVVLAYGEATGHAHAIADSGAVLFRSAATAGVTFMEVRAAVAALEHDEHTTVTLPSGRYRVTRQREYSPEAIRNVSD